MATAEPRRALPRDDADDEDDDLTDLTIDALDDESWDLDESDDDDLEDWDDLEDDVEQHDDAPLARAPRRRSPSSDASPPKSTAFVMLGVTVLVAAAVFLARRLRIRRRASRDAPRVPTLAVDGAAPRKACEHCGATAPKSPGAAKLLRCGRCKSAFFCSVECKRVAWKTHKSVCRPVESDASAPRTDVSAPRTTAAAVAAHRPSQNDSGAATARKSAARDEMRHKIAAERAALSATSELQRRLRDAQGSFWSGRYRESVLALQDIASEAHDVGPVARGIECETLRMAGHGLIRLREFDAADRCLDACVGIARSMRHRGLEANALVAMGQLAATREPPEYDTAVAHHSRARELARETNDVSAEAAACLNLANTTVKRGDRVAGEAFTREALKLRQDHARTMAAAVERAEAAVAAAAAAETEQAETEPAETEHGLTRARMAAASARRQLAEARRAEAAATATLGSTLAAADRRDRSAIAAEIVAGARAEAAEDPSPPSSNPNPSSESADAVDSASTSAGAGSAAEAVSHFHAALGILRAHADEVKDAEMEIGILVNLANVNENQIGGDAGHAAAADARRRLDDAASVVSGGARRLSTTCAVCLEGLVALEVVSARGDDPGGDARRVTCLDCLHCYHSKCWESWTEAREAAGERATCPECKRSQTMV